MSNFSTTLLYTLPYLVGAVSLVINSRHSDKFHERPRHVGAAMIVGGSSILLAVFAIPHSLTLAFALIVMSGTGAYGPMGVFWAIPTETMPSKIVGSVMGW
jgi:MFS transporter, ACS family, tartrate transporter